MFLYSHWKKQVYQVMQKVDAFFIEEKQFEAQWQNNKYTALMNTLTNNNIICMKFKIEDDEIQQPTDTISTIFIITYKSDIVHRTKNKTSKTGTKIKSLMYLHHQHNYTEQSLFNLKWRFYQANKNFTSWQGTKSFSSAFNCEYEKMQTGVIQEINFDNKTFQNVSFTDYKPYIKYNEREKKSKEIENFLTSTNREKYYSDQKLYMGCIMRKMEFPSALKKSIDDQYILYEEKEESKYIKKDEKNNRLKHYENHFYVYEGAEHKQLNVKQLDKAKKLANGIRVFDSSKEKHFSNLTKKVCMLSSQCKVFTEEEMNELDMAGHNKYQNVSSETIYSSIDPHEEYTKFNNMTTFNHGKATRLSLGLKTNTYNGITSIELPPHTFIKWDS